MNAETGSGKGAKKENRVNRAGKSRAEFDALLKRTLQEKADECWAEAEAAEKNAPEEEFFQSYEERESRLAHIRKESKKEKKRLVRKRTVRLLRNSAAVAAVLAAAILIQSAVVKSVDASKVTVVDVVVNYFKEFTEVKNQASEYWTTKYEIKEPTYIPEGYELVKEINGKSRCIKIYENQSGKTIKIIYTSIKTGYTETIDEENKKLEKVRISSYEALYFFSKTNNHILIWNDGVINYKIEAKIAFEEMKKIGESMMNY